MSIGFVQRLPCLESTRAASGRLALKSPRGESYADYSYSTFCYSDAVHLYSADHLDQASNFPYETTWLEGRGTPYPQVHSVEYPVLTGLFMWANAELVRGYDHLARAHEVPDELPVAVYFVFDAIFVGIAWLVVVDLVRRLSGDRPWTALMVAASPLVVSVLFVNFDAFAVALATGGLLAWARRRPLLAGVLIGLGGAAKLYPLLFLIPLLALCSRTGKFREGGRALLGAAGAWAAVNAPFAILYPSGWSYFYRFSQLRSAGHESLFSLFGYLTGNSFGTHLPPDRVPTDVNMLSAVLLVTACGAVCVIAMTAPRRPRLAPLCLLVVAAFLLTNKEYSPQYSLWLVPLAVLSVPRWRVLSPWMVVDALVWIPTMLYLRGPAHGVTEGWFLDAVAVRDLLVLTVCAVAIRHMYVPAKDPVRHGLVDDPCGGVLDGADDRFRLEWNVLRQLRRATT